MTTKATTIKITQAVRDEEAKANPVDYLNDPLPGFGYWDSHPEFTLDAWISQVFDDGTRRGYWEWVRSNIITTGGVLPSPP